MKWSNLALLFACIFLCINVILDSQIQQLYALSSLEIQYNLAVDNAMEAAMYQLVEVDDITSLQWNKEEAVNTFFDSLAMNLGAYESRANKAILQHYVPVIAVILEDGFYIYKEREDPVAVYQKTFGAKIPYLHIEEGRKYYFTLGNTVTICNMEDEVLSQGDYHDLFLDDPVPFMEGDAIFQQVRRQTIIGLITKSMNAAVNDYNTIATQYGIRYQFALPVIENEEWYRTIDHSGMVALFQGYPYGTNITGYYNRVALGGARIRKRGR